MKRSAAQPDLFASDQPDGPDKAALGRARMREMIDSVAAAAVPPWKTQMGLLLDEGAFQRAMQLVPDAEAQALWAEFDVHVARLYAMWDDDNLPPPG